MKKYVFVLFIFFIAHSIFADQTEFNIKFMQTRLKSENIVIGNNIYIFELNNVNKAGIVLSVVGSTLMLTGGALALYDYLGYESIINSAASYEEYKRLYAVDILLLTSGFTFLGIGVAMVAASIPMIIYKKKDKKISFYLQPGTSNILGVCYKF